MIFKIKKGEVVAKKYMIKCEFLNNLGLKMTRHEQREQAFKLLFEQAVAGDFMSEIILSCEEIGGEKVEEFASELACGADAKIEVIDEVINKYSAKWKTHRLAKVSLAVLRLCVYEIMFMESIPVSVSINEAIEIAKLYGTQEDASYVNGVLSSISKDKEVVGDKK